MPVSHDYGDWVWAVTTFLTLIVFNVPSSKMPIGWIRSTYSVYLLCQTLQSLSSVANTEAGSEAHGVFLIFAGYAVAVTGLALLLGGGQVVSEEGSRWFRIFSASGAALACGTVALQMITESEIGYIMYFACTVVFSLCMLWEVFVRKRGTFRMRASVLFATFSACFFGLPDIWENVDDSYLITRLLDSIFYLPFACYSFRLYDDMIANSEVQPSLGGGGVGGSGDDAGDKLVEMENSPPEIEDV
ncbi:hypothetical protein TrCOL_g4625 [Triparma columacea]|uniref:Uncharacterized protein n=1 Tax=Triparma columacea TaxID=722753 RepID=A0A9W7GEW9_9STRA|nr:hypothetical protein TrCOL_g4625 [Triparma columacea]